MMQLLSCTLWRLCGKVTNLYFGRNNNVAFAADESSASNNEVTVDSSNYNGGTINGGATNDNSSDASNNNLEVSDVDVNNNFVNGGYVIDTAGYALSGEASYNKLNIYNGTLNGTTQGGYVMGSGNANNNTVNIYGGTINGNVYGGYVGGSGEVKDNVINIYGNPDLSDANLYAGYIGGNTDLYESGNALNIYTKGITAQDIGGFDTLNFNLPSDITNGDWILRLTEAGSADLASSADNVYGTDLSRTKVNLNTGGSTNLRTGDVITLISNDNGLNISDITGDGKISAGISFDYDVNLSPVSDSDGNVTSYIATVGERGALKSQTQGLTSGPVDSASLLDSGTDRLLEWLPPEALEFHDKNSIPTTGFDPFAGIGGSVVRVKTGDGSYLKSKSGGLNVGMSRYLANRHGTFVFGPVTDYGQDHYNSTMEDGTKGAGNSKYFTAGVIARQMDTGGMYYEGSMRYGRLHTNYVSDNFLVHNEPTHASYSASTPCYAGHVRVGWRNSVSDESILDAYGIYSLNRVSGISTTVSTGERYRFSGVNSGRMRLGARLTRSIRENNKFYSGIAFVHEFTGETRGQYIGLDTKKSGLKGDYGLIELGWQLKPSQNSPMMLDTSLVGMIGDHRGISLNAKFKRDI